MAFVVWPMTCVIPLCVTGENEPPVAINACPPVQAIRSAGVASASGGGAGIACVGGGRGATGGAGAAQADVTRSRNGRKTSGASDMRFLTS